MKITSELIMYSNQWINPIQERQLDLKGNKFNAIENLGTTLDFFNAIDLSDNEISKLTNFSVLKKLKSLIICNNRIQKIADISQSLPNLENLMLTNNKIADLEQIENLANCQNLKRLCLINNQVTQHKNYRLFVIAHISSLKVLDFQKVKQQEREEAEQFKQKYLSQKKTKNQLNSKEEIQKMIENANSMQEINRVEFILKQQQLENKV